jgi:hypothetical protein
LVSNLLKNKNKNKNISHEFYRIFFFFFLFEFVKQYIYIYMVRIEDRKFILFHSNYFDMVPLLGQTPVLYLSRVSTKLWNESYNPKENHPYIFDVVGSIKYFHELSVSFWISNIHTDSYLNILAFLFILVNVNFEKTHQLSFARNLVQRTRRKASGNGRRHHGNSTTNTCKYLYIPGWSTIN